MQTLGDIVQIGLIVLGVYAFGRVLWRAWIRPMFAESEPRRALEKDRVRWSLRDEFARLFLIQGDGTVNHSQAVMTLSEDDDPQTDQTDSADSPVSEADHWLDRLEVDRTKTALIELLVYSGWGTGEIRALIKGDSGAIGLEVEAARKRLGITQEPRMLRVKDPQGERLIPFESKQPA